MKKKIIISAALCISSAHAQLINFVPNTTISATEVNANFNYLNTTKENNLAAGTAAQYYRGDKTWQTLNSTSVPEGTNLYFTEPRVRSTLLTGYTVGSATSLSTSDTFLQAFGKLEGQIQGLTLPTLSGTLPVSKGGTGLSSLTMNSVLATNSIGNIAPLTCSSGQLLGFSSGAPSCITPAPQQWLENADGLYQTSRIGIGTVPSPNSQLNVSGTLAGNSLATFTVSTGTGRIMELLSGGIPRMVMLTNGNMGIGTESPQYALEVSRVNGHTFVGQTTFSGTASDTSILALQKASGTNTTPSAVVNGHQLGQIRFNGYTGTGFAAAATMEAYVAGSFSDTSTPSMIMFKTTNTGSNIPQERIRITPTGFVGIGTASPASMLDVNGEVRGTVFTTISDKRQKRDIAALHSQQELEKITRVEGVTYSWKDSTKGKKKQIGFIAQDLEKVYPELVETDSKGMKSVNYSQLVAPLVESVKALKAENNELKQYICRKDPQAPFCNK